MEEEIPQEICQRLENTCGKCALFWTPLKISDVDAEEQPDPKRTQTRLIQRLQKILLQKDQENEIQDRPQVREEEEGPQDYGNPYQK